MVEDVKGSGSKRFTCDGCGTFGYAAGWWQAKNDGWKRTGWAPGKVEHFCPVCPVPAEKRDQRG